MLKKKGVNFRRSLLIILLITLMLGSIFGFFVRNTFLGFVVQTPGTITLSNYPEPFVTNSKYNFISVYGDTSKQDDIIAIWDIFSGLTITTTETEIEEIITTTSVSGTETDEIPLNSTLTDGFFNSQLKKRDIKSFQDTEIIFNGGSYDIHDELDLGKVGTSGDPVKELAPQVVTSLSSGVDDYGSNVYLETRKGAISYHYVFDEKIVLNDTSTTTPLEMIFLGKKLKIVSIDASNKFTAYLGSDYNLMVGETATVEGKTVTLKNVGQSSVIVDVDGVKATIPSGATEVVNGIEIVVDELFYRTQIEASSATLVVGKDASETIQDGDMYFGGDGNCLKNDPDDLDCWRWRVDDLYAGGTDGAAGNIYKRETSNAGPTIGIESWFVINDDKDNPPTIGDCINLPNNYASICLDSLTITDNEYATYEIYYEDSLPLVDIDSNLESEKVIVIKSSVSEGLDLRTSDFDVVDKSGNQETSLIYLQINDTTPTKMNVFYEDSNNQIQWAGTYTTNDGSLDLIAKVNYDSTSGDRIKIYSQGISSTSNNINISLVITGKYGDITTAGVDDLIIQTTHSASDFSGINKLHWGQSRRDISAKDEDHRTLYGIIIRDPKSSLGTNSLELEIPADQVQVNIVINGRGVTQITSTSTSGTGVVSDTALPPMVKASEVSNPEADNLLIVGGPVVNAMAARFIGSDWAYKPGEAIIELKDNGAKVALVVAGTDAVDTRRAARVLKEYDLYKDKLVSSSVKVTGISATFTDTVIK